MRGASGSAILSPVSADSPEHEPRLFADDAAIVRVGERLLDRTLPKGEWTHEAHLAACVWLLLRRPDVLPERDLPAIISGYNESVGGVNDDTQGYHETLTQLYVAEVRAHVAEMGEDAGLAAGGVVYGRSFNPLIALKALSYFEDVPKLPPEVRSRLLAAVAAVDPAQDLPSLTPYEQRPEGGSRTP